MLRKTHSGFSLLELLLSVMLALLLISAGLYIYRNIARNQRVDDSIRLIHMIKQNTHYLFHDSGTYGGSNYDMEPALVLSGGVPKNYVDNNGQIISPYNGDIDIVSDTGGTQFNVFLDNLTDADCLNIGKIFDNSDPDFVELTINTTTILPQSVNVASVNAACNNGATNSLNWLFR